MMKSYNKYLFVLLIGMLFLSCKVGRFFIYNFADINDHKKFPYRTMERGTETFVFPKAKKPNYPKNITVEGVDLHFDEVLKENSTLAFIIIRNDSIHYEKYFDDYTEASIVPSFSMAKSFISLLIGFAIEDGLIKSVQEPVTNYIPELKEKGFANVTIEHVLQMTSGLDYNEGYTNPFGEVASFYYGRNLRKAVFNLELKQAAGESFEYLSGNSQILGLILHRVLEDKSITEYFEDKIWKPLGMEFDGSWSIDKKRNGLEKTFCCVNARARDFAKIGRLLLNKGKWNSKQLISEEWVEKSTSLDTSNGSVPGYQYQWWLSGKEGDFMASGLLGQYIFVNPNTNVIIVRLGRDNGSIHWRQFLSDISQAL